MRASWAASSHGADQEIAISHEEADRNLLDLGRLQESEAGFYENDTEARQLCEWIEAADIQAAGEDRWKHLRREFGLSVPEIDVLSLAVAAELNPQLRRVYAYLADDAAANYATVLLACGLFQWPSVVMIGPESPLSRWLFARVPEGASWSLTSPCIPDPHIVRWLMGGDGFDPALGSAVGWIRRAEVRKKCLYADVLASMRQFVQAMTSGGGYQPLVELELVGPPGSGKRSLASQLCADLGADLMIVDAASLLGPDVPAPLAAARAIHAAREARLHRAILYWHAEETIDAKIWKAARGLCSLMLFGARSPHALQAESGHTRRCFRLPALTLAQSEALWEALTGAAMPEVLADWQLTPAEIESAARASRAGAEAAVEACRQMLYQEPGELFMPVPCPYTWDDIVLAETIRSHLRELEEQVLLRRHVYEGWGFQRLCPLGGGISALFAGPSGTGKTMAAQVLARSLGRELYRVDLAGLVNKYIGETEKRLKTVFDACERAAVLLFFDEADALFGQRTQVKDAHDRFANIQIDYLLQRMEQFDGIAILATNRKADLDSAFLRRIRFIVDFLPPGPAERMRLWKLALHERSPGGEELLDEIDWEFLAANLNMTGADIKSAALAAAFRARAGNTRITMQHLLASARREMAKHGLVLRAGELGG